MYLASHGKDGYIKCICDLNNVGLQEREIWGGGTLCCSFESLFHIPRGGTQKQMLSAFLMQPEKTIRLPEVPLGW